MSAETEDQGPFSRDFLRRLQVLRLVSRRLHTGRFAALTRSRKIGTGIDFADHRPYSPGDDFKNIDWTLYGRLDQLLIRLAEEETELNIYLLVDASPSMDFGAPSKAEFAHKVACALTYVGLSHLDRVHIYPFGSELLPPLTPPRNAAQVFNVWRHLQRASGTGESSLARAARSFVGVARTRGVALVLSDFLMDDWRPGLDILRSARFEVGLVHVSSPEERSVPAGSVRREVDLRDRETGRGRRVRLSPALARRYREAVVAHGEELAAYARQYRLFYAYSGSDQPFEELVLRTFRSQRLLA